MSPTPRIPLIPTANLTVSLRFLLVIPFIVQLFLTIALVGFLSFHNGQRSVDRLAAQLSEEITHRIEERIQTFADTPHLFLQLNQAAIATGQFDPDNFETAFAYFWQQLSIHPWVRSLYYGNTQGNFIQLSRDPNPEQGNKLSLRDRQTAPLLNIYRLDDRGNRTGEKLLSNEYDPRTRPWYQAAVTAKTGTWSPIYSFANSARFGITPTHPIYDDRGMLRGVLAIDYTLDRMNQFLASLEIGSSGQAFIMERSGKLVATSTAQSPSNESFERLRAIDSPNPLIQQCARYLQSLGAIDGPQSQLAIWNGKRYLVRIDTLNDGRGLDWILVVAIPEADFMTQIHANTQITIVLCAMAVLGATISGIVLCNWLSQPIAQLSRGVGAIARGEEAPRVYGGPIRELVALARGFNQMACQLRVSFEAWEQAQASLEQLVDKRTRALYRARDRFHKVFRLSPHPLFISAIADGRLLEVNQQLCQTLEYSPDALLDRREGELQLWVNPQEHQQLVQEIEIKGVLRDREVEMQTASGITKTLLLSGEKIGWDGYECILYAAHDITERQRALLALQESEAALRDQQNYLHLVLNNIPQQVFWKDTNSVFLGCNRNWSEAAGLDNPETVIGKTDFDLLSPELARRFRAQDRMLMESNTPELHILAQKVNSGDNGEPIWLDISKIPIHDTNDRVIGLLGVIEDITLRKKAEDALRIEQAKSEKLLLNILPEPIVQQLKDDYLDRREMGGAIAEYFQSVTILFADLVGFTSLSSRLNAVELVQLLDRVFSEFDRLSSYYGLEKIKTIGDAYMVAGGLPLPQADHAIAIANMALEMQEAIGQIQTPFQYPLQLRIGINTGPVVAGAIGTRKFIYDLWGDAVNIASRMESQGKPGRIQVTQDTYELLRNNYYFQERGKINIKGKGEMFTYWLLDRSH
ncbi:adenylate/guanylate cyclase domain-containing protein [Roseofilum casamattae]|uniref:Adenylate/guanylate cyclase domain-containing protein n=1 Tax=Roseofilum casamattae BLCC-M143 TaxID=3022442 RepID=A0ABT7BVQ1_9CYAN|nr:adenylate/guanylate cyclase domain-containing protein [Roseofilum casamattae]MDJ1182887.1 adenylate/guanylate cyclase domain-containing protein [Roseofilum casamattae BLCC-M143]